MSGEESIVRVAAVTGASGGLGKAISLRLAREGCHLAALYHQNDASATSVVNEITSAGGHAVAVQANVADPEAVEAAIHGVMEKWHRIDVLVCNAGVFSRSTIVETSDDEFDRTFAINVKGVFNCIRAALPIMINQQSGRVITISSHNAKRGTGMSSKATYAATKSAVESYTRGAAVEMAPHGITVNCVSPGWIPKEPLPPEPTEFQRAVLEGIPLGRPGLDTEVAAAVAFLSSEEAGYITGETLDVNGGTWMD